MDCAELPERGAANGSARAEAGTLPARMSWDADRHLREELARLAHGLLELITRPREGDRREPPTAFGGMAIDEVDHLLGDLAADWGGSATPSSEAASHVRVEIAERARAAAREGVAMPLLETAQAFELEPAEYDGVLLALAVELDARFARVVGFLNDHTVRQRPTLGLVASLARLESGRTISCASLVERPVVRDGLLALEGDGPLSTQAVRLPTDVLGFLARGAPRRLAASRVRVHPPRPGALRSLVLDEETLRRALELVEALKRDPRGAPALFAGARGDGRATIARAVASEVGLTLIEAEPRAADWHDVLRCGRLEARMAGRSLLLLRGDEDLPWDEVWAACADLACTMAVTTTRASVDAVMRHAPRRPAVLTLPERSLADRVRLWKALLPPDGEVRDVEAVATRFPFAVRGIARAIERAASDVALLPPDARRLDDEAIGRACRAVGETMMGANAQKLPLPFTRADLVVAARVAAELDLASVWIKHRRRVFDDWGFGARLVFGQGMTALFAGPPGTGKTMAAQVLARELGVDAYRIDLSRVMSKYIGETEKNLASLFDEAKASGAVLLFDEAEALFGKRSEVSDAHDRYANVEIAFLLQRMEEHPGVTVLATNRLRDLDEAFLRRFYFIVDFPVPEQADRLRIWQGMLPKACERDADVDCAALARDFEITGGEIKNAALAAAFMAAGEGVPVGNVHLRAAVRREMAKSGKVVDGRGR
jgi:SpoVK/Ycf46/Vps4 family AAA+-type ATPase